MTWSYKQMALFAVAIIALFAVVAAFAALYYGLILAVLLKVLEYFGVSLLVALVLA